MCLQSWANIAIIATAVIYAGLLFISKLQLDKYSRLTDLQIRQEAWNGFFNDFDRINNYIQNCKDKSFPPMYPEFRSPNEAIVLIYHHLNLIFRFWKNNELKLLSPDEVSGFDRWINNVFFHWVLQKTDLCYDLKTIIELKDLYPDDFINWISKKPKYKEDVLRIAK